MGRWYTSPHTRVGRTSRRPAGVDRPATSPHTHGKNVALSRPMAWRRHLPTHAWEERTISRPNATWRSTSPHTRGKNPRLQICVPDGRHLPTHAWEERIPGPSGAPPHTRVGRTSNPLSSACASPTSPHTRGKNHGRSARLSSPTHLPTHAWEEPQAVVVTKTAKHNALGFLKKKGQPYSRVWEPCPCSTETKP